MHLTVLGQHIVVLNSFKATYDLLYLRGAIYSSRPYMVWLGELVGWHQSISFMPYNERWKIHRQAFTRHMSKIGVREYHSTIERQTRLHVSRMLANPADYVDEFRL